jgi:hypothetical protein
MAAPKEPNTAPARQAKRAKSQTRAAAVGTLADVRAKLWACIGRVEKLTEADDAGTVLRAAHAMVQACGAYVKVVEVGELEARLGELEKSLESRGSGHRPMNGRAYA